MFTKIFFFIVIISSTAYSCSCGGIDSIESAIKKAPNLIHVKVTEIIKIKGSKYVSSVVLKNIKSLKGSEYPKVFNLYSSACYKSFSVEDLKLNNEYILPLNKFSLKGRNYLLMCSHSGLLLKNRLLYKNDFIKEKPYRKLVKYMKYDNFIY